ncbi:MAG: gamma-glutamylcyclotransferase [Pseudomonadota bacterium]
MDADPYAHLPHLRGCLTPVAQSALRVTPQALAAWDAQACARGLPPDWRWSEQQIEASRCALLGAGPSPQDLWVFGYGSLMWDPAMHFSEVRRAELAGHARRFSYRTLMGRGTPERPALMLTLEPAADCCHGLVFRIPAALAAEETAMLWRREMVRGGYCPQQLAVCTPQGPVQALAFLSNRAHPGYIGELPLAESAAIIAAAAGQLGRNRDYLAQLDAQLLRLGIADDYIHRLWAAVQALAPE